MALTLVKEDGTGKADANAYADVADGGAYFEGHLYPTAWTGATADQKAAALVMATRVIDAEYQFDGARAVEGQALQWPRSDCPDMDGGAGVVLPSDAVPKNLLEATCELARELLIVDRTASPPGEGIQRQENADMSATTYSKVDTRQILTPLVRVMLAKYGMPVTSGKSVVPLIRV